MNDEIESSSQTESSSSSASTQAVDSTSSETETERQPTGLDRYEQSILSLNTRLTDDEAATASAIWNERALGLGDDTALEQRRHDLMRAVCSRLTAEAFEQSEAMAPDDPAAEEMRACARYLLRKAARGFNAKARERFGNLIGL